MQSIGDIMRNPDEWDLGRDDLQELDMCEPLGDEDGSIPMPFDARAFSRACKECSGAGLHVVWQYATPTALEPCGECMASGYVWDGVSEREWPSYYGLEWEEVF
jgi:hypothetical protein